MVFSQKSNAPKEEKVDQNKHAPPEHKFNVGAIHATIWKNSTEKDGKVVEFNTVTLDRNYKDNKDQWQKTNTFRVSDLPKAILALQKTYELLMTSTGENEEQ